MPRKCLHEGCNTRASYGDSQQPNFCATHAKSGMVDVRRKRCNAKDQDNNPCPKVASYGFLGKTAESCAHHAINGMVNIRHKTCAHLKCFTRPSRGLPGSTKAEFCSKHAPEGTISIYSKKRKRCAHPGCRKNPFFLDTVGSSTNKRFCSEHDADGGVDTVDTSCAIPVCSEETPYDVSGISEDGEIRSRDAKNQAQHSIATSIYPQNGESAVRSGRDELIPAPHPATGADGKRNEPAVIPSPIVDVHDSTGKRSGLRFGRALVQQQPMPAPQQQQQQQQQQRLSTQPAGRPWGPPTRTESATAPTPLISFMHMTDGLMNGSGIARSRQVLPYALEPPSPIFDGRTGVLWTPALGVPVSDNTFDHRGGAGWRPVFGRREGIIRGEIEGGGNHLPGGIDMGERHDVGGSFVLGPSGSTIDRHPRGSGWRPVFGSLRSAGRDEGMGWRYDGWEDHQLGAVRRRSHQGECYPFDTFGEFKARRNLGRNCESNEELPRAGEGQQAAGVGGGALIKQEVGMKQEVDQDPQDSHHHGGGRDAFGTEIVGAAERVNGFHRTGQWVPRNGLFAERGNNFRGMMG